MLRSARGQWTKQSPRVVSPPHLQQPSMPATLLLVGMVTAVLHREELAVTMDDKACGHDVVLPEPLNRWWKR
jgi:hypothetical protein